MVRRKRRNDRGAALIEFALIMPLLVLLLVGVTEGGWAFSNLLDSRHAAREGARLAAVAAGDENYIVQETCLRLKDQLRTATTVSLSRPNNPIIGDFATVTVKTDHPTLTGLFGFFGGITFNEEATIRLEQTNGLWANVTDQPCPP